MNTNLVEYFGHGYTYDDIKYRLFTHKTGNTWGPIKQLLANFLQKERINLIWFDYIFDLEV